MDALLRVAVLMNAIAMQFMKNIMAETTAIQYDQPYGNA